MVDFANERSEGKAKLRRILSSKDKDISRREKTIDSLREMIEQKNERIAHFRNLSEEYEITLRHSCQKQKKKIKKLKKQRRELEDDLDEAFCRMDHVFYMWANKIRGIIETSDEHILPFMITDFATMLGTLISVDGWNINSEFPSGILEKVFPKMHEAAAIKLTTLFSGGLVKFDSIVDLFHEEYGDFPDCPVGSAVPETLEEMRKHFQGID